MGTPPLISLGQGEYRQDIYPEDLGMTATTDTQATSKAQPTTKPVLDLRFLTREPAEVYHGKQQDYLSSHALGEFRRCPLMYRKRKMGLVPDRDSTAYLVGRAAHTLILEGREKYEREYIVGGPINPKTGNPYGSNTKAFTEWAQKQVKEVLTDHHASLVEQMHVAVNEHLFARELLAEGVAEGVVRCRYKDHKCQARIDWINPLEGRGIVDLKTADDLDAFELAIRSYGYIYQLAFYRAVIAQASGHMLPVHIIAVEKREPFRCGVWQISPTALDQAQELNESAMLELRICRESGNWFTRYESMRLIDRL